VHNSRDSWAMPMFSVSCSVDYMGTPHVHNLGRFSGPASVFSAKRGQNMQRVNWLLWIGLRE
jgi:hypothetical protein